MIEVRYFENKIIPNHGLFRAYKNDGEHVGSLDFGKSTFYKPVISIESIFVKAEVRNQGIGADLVRAFGEILPKGTSIKTCISHIPSLNYLSEQGFLDRVKESGDPFEITDLEVLKNIQLVRLLQKGSIQTENILISPFWEKESNEPVIVILLRGCKV